MSDGKTEIRTEIQEDFTYDTYNDDEKELYNSSDITEMTMDPIDLARTWKVMVVFRNIALDKSDFQRVSLYSLAIEDMATMLQSIGFPIPSVTLEVGPASATDLVNRVAEDSE